VDALSQNYLVRIVSQHYRLYVSIAIGLTSALVSSEVGVKSKVTQSIVSYDLGTIVYICWAFYLMYKSTLQEIRSRALKQDDGKVIVLILAVIAIIFATWAIFADLGSVKHLDGTEKYGSLVLALTTIVASWFFTATIFALHYAHDYYFQVQHGKDGGLIFLPVGEDPSYWDFMYFSFILSATAQTADVTLASTQMRRTCTLHSILAFFFNTSLLALAVNMASGLV